MEPALKCPNCGSTDIRFIEKKNIYTCLECGHQFSKPDEVQDMGFLPAMLAFPVKEYYNQKNPKLKLWDACDIVESVLKLVVIVRIGELYEKDRLQNDATKRMLNDKLKQQLEVLIKRPTLGDWRGMAQMLVSGAEIEHSAIPEFSALMKETLVPLLDAPKDEQKSLENSFSYLRNKLAHGGITEKKSEELYQVWKEKLDGLIKSLQFFENVVFVTRNANGALAVLKTPGEAPQAFENQSDIEDIIKKADADYSIFMVRGKQCIPLYPMLLFGKPARQDDRQPGAAGNALHVYNRKEDQYIEYSITGSNESDICAGTPKTLDAFMNIFKTEIPESLIYKVKSFADELEKEAQMFIGREPEIETVKEMLVKANEGVLWLSGPGGIGKSFLVAKIATDILKHPPANTEILVFHFKHGDYRFSRRIFLNFAIERLKKFFPDTEDKSKQDDKKETRPEDELRDLLKKINDKRILFILDGLDEINNIDPSFAKEIPFGLNLPNVAWFCAGRNEGGLQDIFTSQSCQIVFPQGLPAMVDDDIRAMVLNEINSSKHLRNRLLGGDKDKGEGVINPFIEKVALHAEGLPLYVRWVINDIKGGKYTHLDAGEQLPKNLPEYCEELLRRLSIGDMQQVLTPLICTIALLKEPVSLPTLAALLERRKIITSDEAGTQLLQQAVYRVQTMLKTAPTPEGDTGYTIYHNSIREHILQSPVVKVSIATAREALCEAAVYNVDKEYLPYFYRNGPKHLIEAQRWDDVENILCDVFFMEERAKQGLLDTQQADYSVALSLILDSESKKCLADFFYVFLREKHNLRNYPEITYQQIYNELQWRKGKIKTIVEEARNLFLSKGRLFIHQYREPQIAISHLIMTLKGHTGGVLCCAFSPDGRRIVSGSYDNTLKIWDVETGREITSLLGHKGVIHSLALFGDPWYYYDGIMSCVFSPDGKRIVSGGVDDTLKIWDTDKGKEIMSLALNCCTSNSCTFSPDGKQIVSQNGNNSFKIWEADTGKEIMTLSVNSKSISTCAFSPDGKQIVSGGFGDNNIKIWDVKTGKEIRTLTGQPDGLKCCTISPNCKRIVSGSSDKTLKIWDSETGQEISTLTGHTDKINCCNISPDCKFIISGSEDKTLKIWNAETGQEIRTLTGHTDGVKCCAISHDGKKIVSGSIDKTLKIWDAETGKEIIILKGFNSYATSYAFSPDNKLMISGNSDKTLKLWDVETGRVITSFTGHSDRIESCTFSPDSRQIVTGSYDKTLKIWETLTGKEINSLKGHSKEVSFCSYSPDGRRIVSVSKDNTLKIWNAGTGKLIYTLTGHNGSINSWTFSPDGKRIVSGSDDNTLKIWDVESGREFTILKGHSSVMIFDSSLGEFIPSCGVTSCAFSPDGKRIVSGGVDNILKVWDVETGKEIATLSGHREWSFGSTGIISCVFSPDGKWIVSGSHDEILKIWDAETSREIMSFKGHIDYVKSCAFLPDGKRIVSISLDKTLKIWDAKTGKEYSIFVFDTDIIAFALSECGLKIVCDDKDGNFFLLKLEESEIRIPVVTGVRLWYFNPFENEGEWDKEITTVCPFCGECIPCNIPEHAEFDDPRLLQDCPNCGKKLKFNPFVVDNGGK